MASAISRKIGHVVADALATKATAPGPLRGIGEPRIDELERFKDLWDGALLDDRVH